MLQELAETIRSHLDLQKETPNAPQSPEPCGVEDGLLSKWDGDHAVFLLGNKSQSICKKSCWTFVLVAKICFRGQVHEESAEVLCLASLKGLVHRVVDEWPVKS